MCNKESGLESRVGTVGVALPLACQGLPDLLYLFYQIVRLSKYLANLFTRSLF